MRNIFFGMLAVVLATSTLFAGTARAALTANGISLNGLAANGISLNGLAANGISINGLAASNGFAMNGLAGSNGFSMNGLAASNGFSMNGLTAWNDTFTGNDLRRLTDRRAARVAILIANGIDFSKPLSQVGQD